MIKNIFNWTAGQPYRKPFKPYSKTANIEKAVQRKENSIKTYTDNKDKSIAISSATNFAGNMVIELVAREKGKDFTQGMIRDSIATNYEMFLRIFLNNQNDTDGVYMKIQQEIARKNEIFEQAGNDEAIADFGSNERSDQPLITE